MNLGASLKFSLVPRGREVGRLAWVPRLIVPYVGAGGGAFWYAFTQEGDFVDFVGQSIFHDVFDARGWTPSAHAFAGADWFGLQRKRARASSLCSSPCVVLHYAPPTEGEWNHDGSTTTQEVDPPEFLQYLIWRGGCTPKAGISPVMRVRISRKVPPEYGLTGKSLVIGRVYNLDTALASALILERCADLYDLLSPAEKRASAKLMGEEEAGPRPASRSKLPES